MRQLVVTSLVCGLCPMSRELRLSSGPFLSSAGGVLYLAVHLADPDTALLTWLPSLTGDLPRHCLFVWSPLDCWRNQVYISGPALLFLLRDSEVPACLAVTVDSRCTLPCRAACPCCLLAVKFCNFSSGVCAFVQNILCTPTTLRA